MFRATRFVTIAILTATVAPNTYASPPVKHHKDDQPVESSRPAILSPKKTPVNHPLNNPPVFNPKVTAVKRPVWHPVNGGQLATGTAKPVWPKTPGFWRPTTGVVIALDGNVLGGGGQPGAMDVPTGSGPVTTGGSESPVMTGGSETTTPETTTPETTTPETTTPETTTPETTTPEMPALPDPDAVFGVALTKSPDGAAAAAKLKPNDVIMSLGALRTEKPEDLDDAAKKFAGQKVIAVILDGATGEEKPVFVTPEADGTFGATVQQVRVK